MTGSAKLAFLAHGELFVLDGASPRKIESKFADAYRERVRALQKRQSWKEDGAGARFMRGGTAALWGDDMELEAVPVAYTGVARRGAGRILYTISTGVVGGVLEHDLSTGEEKRLFHSADKRIEQIATSRDHEVVACTLRGKGGISAIAVMAADGSDLQTVTDGDVIDLAPQWLPGPATKADRPHQLVYQSAGIGRNAQGIPVAIGPASIGLLDAEGGDMQVVMEREGLDFLLPRMDASRTLFVVRRAYTDAGDGTALSALLDAVLLPFRLLMAVFGFLSFFTMRYTGKPLFTSGNARRRSADLRQMMMMGNLASARDDAQREAERSAAAAVRGWELVAIREDQTERIVARGVRAFDLTTDGAVLVTDGAKIERVDPDGKRTTLVKERGITEVVALD